MRLIKTYILVLVIILITTKKTNGSHLVGGTMHYECLGGNDYKITLTVYRDCNSTGAAFDPNARINFFDVNNNLVNTATSSFPGSDSIPIILNPCFIQPPSVCVEKAEYEFFINLPPLNGGYTAVYQRCCRNMLAVNIVNPSTMGSTYKVHIPGPDIVTCNNSPTFNNPPPTILCSSYEFNYDLSATDLDGDSLVYSFADAINGGSQTDPLPDPAAPPHMNILWNTGYSTNYQIDANPAFTINPNTGYLSGTPTNNGFYTFCVAVKEYRNGVYISEIYRDFLLIITACQTNTVASFPAQSDLCTGFTFNFTNNSLNAASVLWDFGDLSTLSDTSIINNPIYTYPDTGVYEVSLIANPGLFCSDTLTHQYTVYPEINPSYDPQQDQCLEDNLFTINALGNYDADASINWIVNDPSFILSGQNSPTVQLSFPEEGNYPVTLSIENNGCIDNYTDTINIFVPPVPDFTIVGDTGCQPFIATFQNNSFAQTPIFYEWDFGDGNTSTEESPSHTYENSGVFDVSLIVSTNSGCIDTQELFLPDLITVHPKPQSKFIATPTETHFMNHIIDLQDISGELFQVFHMGDGQSFTDRNVTYSYLDTGHYKIEQYVINEYNCMDTSSQIIWIKPDLLIYIPNTFTPNNDGLNEVFLPKIKGIKSYEVQILNRWGELIFESNNMNIGWNGTHKNKIAPVGNYIWKINFKPVDSNVTKSLIGSVSLIR